MALPESSTQRAARNAAPVAKAIVDHLSKERHTRQQYAFKQQMAVVAKLFN